jgi:hypothetical protein
MANEVAYRHSATGATLYFTIRRSSVSRTMWNTSGTPNFETLAVANWASYAIAMTETPAGGYLYRGTFPAVGGNMTSSYFEVDVFVQAGGSPAISDSLVDRQIGYWTGSTFVLYTKDNQTLSGIPWNGTPVGNYILPHMILHDDNNDAMIASGKFLAGAFVDVTAADAAAVAAQTDIAALIGIQSGSVITEAALANAGTAGDVADSICDEALSGHVTPGTLGKALSDILDDTGTSGVVVKAASTVGAFPAAALVNAPTGSTATYSIAQPSDLGKLIQQPLTAYKGMAIAWSDIDFATAQTAGTFTFTVTSLADKATALWTLDNTHFTLAGDALGVDIADTDAYTTTAGVYWWYITNTATDSRVAEGVLTIKA